MRFVFFVNPCRRFCLYHHIHADLNIPLISCDSMGQIDLSNGLFGRSLEFVVYSVERGYVIAPRLSEF